MAKRPDVSTLASGFRSSNKLNDNFNGIKEAFDNTISRDGSGPNEMLADFDLNGYKILNTPAPVDPTDVVRLQDIAEVSGDVAVFKLDTDGDNATPELLTNIGAVASAELEDDTGATLVGVKASGAGTVARTLAQKLEDFRTLEDFGAVGYSTFAAAIAGVDSTAAVQAAIDWASGGGTVARGLRLTANIFKTGNIELRNSTTIIGAGRQVSGFIAKAGTTGKFWSAPASAQKVTLEGFLISGNGEMGITHGLELVTGQAGTEGYIRDLWVRDCPNGYAFDVDGNVYYIFNSTGQTCKFPIRFRGEGNILVGFTAMQAGQGATVPAEGVAVDLDGVTAYGLHIEAPANGALPIRMSGHAHIIGYSYSPSTTTIEAFAEINTLNHNDYVLIGGHLINPGNVTLTGGCLKVGSSGAWRYQYGTTITNIQGLAHVGVRSNVGSVNGLMIRRRRFQSFRIRIANNGGAIQARIGSSGDSELAASQLDRITGATTTFNTIGATFAGGIAQFSASGNGHRIAFDTEEQNPTGEGDYQFSMMAQVCGNTTGAAAPIVSFGNFATTVNAVSRTRPSLDFLDPLNTTTKWVLNTTNIPTGTFIEVLVWAWLL